MAYTYGGETPEYKEKIKRRAMFLAGKPKHARSPYVPKPIDQDHLQKDWDLGEVLDTVDSHYRIIEEQLGKLVAKLDVIEEMMKNGKNKSASRKA